MTIGVSSYKIFIDWKCSSISDRSETPTSGEKALRVLINYINVYHDVSNRISLRLVLLTCNLCDVTVSTMMWSVTYTWNVAHSFWKFVVDRLCQGDWVYAIAITTVRMIYNYAWIFYISTLYPQTYIHLSKPTHAVILAWRWWRERITNKRVTVA